MRLFRILFLSLGMALATLSSSAVLALDSPVVNINTADAETLATELKGVGPSKAQAIVAYRESVGPFQSVEELTAVKGIGESLIAKNREKIVLD